MALNVNNIIGLSVAHAIDITTALIVISTYLGHRAHIWLFQQLIRFLCCSTCGCFSSNSSSTSRHGRLFFFTSKKVSDAKRSLYIMLHICLIFCLTRITASAFHVARYAITTNYDFSLPPSKQTLTRPVHILNSIQNAFFIIGLYLYCVIFAILIHIWLEVVRTLQDLYSTSSSSSSSSSSSDNNNNTINNTHHRTAGNFGRIRYKVVRAVLIVVLSILALFVVPAIVTYAVPREKLVDKRVINWVVGYTCGPVFAASVFTLITVATVVGIKILYYLRINNHNNNSSDHTLNQSSGHNSSNHSKRIVIKKIAISLIVFMITLIIQLVGIVLNSLDFPVWSMILFLQSIPDIIGITMVMLIFSPFEFVNRVWSFALTWNKQQQVITNSTSDNNNDGGDDDKGNNDNNNVVVVNNNEVFEEEKKHCSIDQSSVDPIIIISAQQKLREDNEGENEELKEQEQLTKKENRKTIQSTSVQPLQLETEERDSVYDHHSTLVHLSIESSSSSSSSLSSTGELEHQEREDGAEDQIKNNQDVIRHEHLHNLMEESSNRVVKDFIYTTESDEEDKDFQQQQQQQQQQW